MFDATTPAAGPHRNAELDAEGAFTAQETAGSGAVRHTGAPARASLWLAQRRGARPRRTSAGGMLPPGARSWVVHRSRRDWHDFEGKRSCFCGTQGPLPFASSHPLARSHHLCELCFPHLWKTPKHARSRCACLAPAVHVRSRRRLCSRRQKPCPGVRLTHLRNSDAATFPSPLLPLQHGRPPEKLEARHGD